MIAVFGGTCPEAFYIKRCSEILCKIHRKSLEPESLSNKSAGIQPETLFKKRHWRRRFPVKFAKFFRNIYFIEHIQASASESSIPKSKLKTFKLCPKSDGKGVTMSFT